jgi:hypothetical protein
MSRILRFLYRGQRAILAVAAIGQVKNTTLLFECSSASALKEVPA